MPHAGSSNDRLPDDLLFHVFSSLPCFTAWVLDGEVTLGSLGAVERVCRRLRRLALGLAGQHPVDIRCKAAAFGANTCSPAVSQEVAHCLDARSPAVVTLHQPTGAVAALLLGLHLPAVRRLTVKGLDMGDSVLPSLPHTFPALEELCTRVVVTPHTDAAARDQAYPAALRLWPGLTAVDMRVPTITPDLVTALLALPQLQSVRLVLSGRLLPGAATLQKLGQLGPCLQHVSIMLDSPGERVPTELFKLPAMAELVLTLLDHEGELEGLQRLRSLRRLELYATSGEGVPVPSSCWACSHLTALLLSCFSLEVPAGTAATLSTLRRLELSAVEFPGGGFPAEICLLPQLTALSLDAMAIDPCLPSDLSKLSNFRELCITGPESAMDAEGLLVLRSLTALTDLQLEECVVEGVPVRAMYPPSLQQLTISEQDAEILCTLLLPALFVSPSLQRLHLTLARQAVTEQAHWWRLAAVLKGHRSLQELHVELRDEEWQAMTSEEERRVWGQLRQKLGAAGVTAALRHLVQE